MLASSSVPWMLTLPSKVNMLTRQDLMTLEDYAAVREEYRARARQHRRDRQVQLGRHVTLCFEDRDTVLYQIQEMLYIERTFDGEGIQDELDAYNPLVPQGSNLTATMMIEYSDPEERALRLQELIGIEHKVYVEIFNRERIYAVADEDLERTTPDKTSAVHFLRFNLTPSMLHELSGAADLIIGVDHAHYRDSRLMTMETKQNLLKHLLVFHR